ncbi:MAG: exo-alpha-sialidase [Pirellulales bacterium]|nr:exo-alpha-sialidase [Pirellulales bacterium]
MPFAITLQRRDFFKTAAATVCGIEYAACRSSVAPAERIYSSPDLIQRIERSIIFNGRKTGTTWFQPRCCRAPDGDDDFALLCMQPIGGSDLYGPVHWTVSKDNGVAWSEPEPIPGLGRRKLSDGWEEGVCDVVPEHHPHTGTVLAVGHNVYYRNNVLAQPQRSRWPVYVVRAADGRWSLPKKLVWDDPRGRFIYTCNCGQRVNMPNGNVLLPLSFAAKDGQPRSLVTARCAFDGARLTVRQVGNVLSNPTKRGLLEPSLVRIDGRYYMTIRAEDDRGYVVVSDDGLQWKPQRPWRWDDGEPLVTASTQQHWLPHSDGLFLVYTRKDSANENVPLWRAPLFAAEVDRQSLRLIRASEKIVFPLIGDGVRDGEHVALMGNFHTLAATAGESWITVGESRPRDGWTGDTLLARVHWRRPNRLVS